ncbi:MAG: hypothetical protein KA807_12015 [Prolixibacteraceae bacterium]|nr:hypothetical protein [Prolixibacteraceae bacterium]
MKKHIFLVLTVIPVVLSGQDFNKVYFNKYWLITSIDNAVFYRISGFNDTIPMYDGKIMDYYYVSDKIQMSGYYENGKKNGEFRFYFPSGTERLIINYKDDKRNGTWKEYYENGELKLELNYKDGKEFIIQINDNIKGASLIKNNMVNYQFDELDQPLGIVEAENPALIEKRYKGKIINNLRQGTWTIYHNGKLNAVLKYKNGILTNGFLLVDDMKYTINDNLAFPLISDQYKFTITEAFMFEPGAIIKNNYVTEGLHNNSEMNRPKITINSRKELEELIYSNYDLRSLDSEDTMHIIISVDDKKPIGCRTVPKVAPSSIKDLNSILSSIQMLNFEVQDSIMIDYIIKKEENIKK